MTPILVIMSRIHTAITLLIIEKKNKDDKYEALLDGIIYDLNKIIDKLDEIERDNNERSK